jgi:ubiquitin carboxyl-terminal hydrolase 5/13
VHAKKFQLVNWVPAKLGPFHLFSSSIIAGNLHRQIDIPVNLPEGDELVFTEAHFGRGLQNGEIELPNDAAGESPQRNRKAICY